jgi:hypothetical protein
MDFILNSDFGYTVAASILTSIGLGTNEIPQMIGGMLISPMANPIINILNTGVIAKNVIQLIILILTCIVIGMIYFQFFLAHNKEFKPTKKMTGIADFKGSGYWNDIVYGLVIGICIYSIHNKLNLYNTNIVAGIAIGVTILPAFVNSGIMFGAGLNGLTITDDNKIKQNLSMNGVSSAYVGFIYLITILIGFTIATQIHAHY